MGLFADADIPSFSARRCSDHDPDIGNPLMRNPDSGIAPAVR